MAALVKQRLRQQRVRENPKAKRQDTEAATAADTAAATAAFSDAVFDCTGLADFDFDSE